MPRTARGIKPVTFQNDKRRHSGEKKYACEGELGFGGKWGCGRRFGRVEDLGRHFQSEAGRSCIKPFLEEEAAERDGNRIVEQQNKYLGGSPQRALGGFALPAALLALYPALENVDWSSMPLVENPKEETLTRLCSVIKPALEHSYQLQQFAQQHRFDGSYTDVSMDLHSSFPPTDDFLEIFKPEMHQTSFLDFSPESTCTSLSSIQEPLIPTAPSSIVGSPYLGATHGHLRRGSWADDWADDWLTTLWEQNQSRNSEKAIFSNGEIQTLVTPPIPCTGNGLPLVDGNTNVCFEESQSHDKALKEATAKLNANCHDSLLSFEAPRAIAVLPGCATGHHSTPSQGLKTMQNESRTALPDTDTIQDPLYTDRHPDTEHEDSSFPPAGSETEITSVQGAVDGNEDIGKLSERGPSPLLADETSPEPESDGGYESTTERSILSCSQKDLISRLMDEICSSFFFLLTHGPRQRGPKPGESFSSDGTQTSICTKTSYENGSYVSRGKRARDDDEDPSDERRHKRKRRPSKESLSDPPLAEIRYFACPFHKFDMSTYSDRNSSPDLALKYRSCGPPGRPTIGRMK
jgi:hypothetical protein